MSKLRDSFWKTSETRASLNGEINLNISLSVKLSFRNDITLDTKQTMKYY